MMVLFLLLWAGGALRLVAHPIELRAGCAACASCNPTCPSGKRTSRAISPRNWQRLLDLSVCARQSQHHHLAGSGPAATSVRPRSSLAGRDRAFDRHRRTLITGATRAHAHGGQIVILQQSFHFRARRRAGAVYDKFHLVPFGEYVPYADILNRIGITKLTAGQEGFDSGDGPHTYQIVRRAAGVAR